MILHVLSGQKEKEKYRNLMSGEPWAMQPRAPYESRATDLHSFLLIAIQERLLGKWEGKHNVNSQECFIGTLAAKICIIGLDTLTEKLFYCPMNATIE